MSNICFTTGDLVKYADGKCGAWSWFFTDVLSSQGIESQFRRRVRTAYNWYYGRNGIAFLIYPSLPGQGNSHPEYRFDDHSVVEYQDLIYDPSYGVLYSQELDWEDASVEYLVYDVLGWILDTKGIQETDFDP